MIRSFSGLRIWLIVLLLGLAIGSCTRAGGAGQPDSGQSQAGSGSLRPATSMPTRHTPTAAPDPTAFLQTQEAALDDSHLRGPPLGPGDATVTPEPQPRSEAENAPLPATPGKPASTWVVRGIGREVILAIVIIIGVSLIFKFYRSSNR